MGKVAVHYGWIPMILYIGEALFITCLTSRLHTKLSSTDILEVCLFNVLSLMIGFLYRLEAREYSGTVIVERGMARALNSACYEETSHLLS